MNLHGNAALSLRGRERVVELRRQDRSFAEIASAIGASERSCRKWWARWVAQGPSGLVDRSSRPKRSPSETPPERVEAIRLLRGLRFSGPQIAELLAMPSSTVSAVLKREGMGRLGRIGLETPKTFQVDRPGEVIHLDTKKLGRIVGGAGHRITGKRRHNFSKTDGAGVRRRSVGWEVVHVAIDGYSRLAYAEVLADEKGPTTVAFVQRALAFYASHGIVCERLHTDNGSPYVSGVFGVFCGANGIRHSRSPAYHPQTNGKAERFIRTMLEGWAYGPIYGSSNERTRALDGWLLSYNHRRPHAALNGRPPACRVPPGPGT
jgi:transposase InsO family protein